mgnify:CR=1 FL=1
MAIKSIPFQKITPTLFKNSFDNDGYVVVENVFDNKFIDDIIPELKAAIEKESKEFHGSKEHKDYGMLLACCVHGGKFLDVVEHKPYIEPFNWILGDTSIIWVYTSSAMAPNSGNYSSRIHVDRPYFTPNYIDAMGSLILLNDFTEENGATYILPKSHLKEDEPSEEYFYKNAERLIAPKGSVFYFNLRLWHAGGKNISNDWRYALGIGMIKPYLKQRIDLPSALEHVDISSLTSYGKQKLGFYSQPPKSIAQYYKNAELALIQKSEWDLDREREKFLANKK